MKMASITYLSIYSDMLSGVIYLVLLKEILYVWVKEGRDYMTCLHFLATIQRSFQVRSFRVVILTCSNQRFDQCYIDLRNKIFQVIIYKATAESSGTINGRSLNLDSQMQKCFEQIGILLRSPRNNKLYECVCGDGVIDAISTNGPSSMAVCDEEIPTNQTRVETFVRMWVNQRH